MVSTHCRAVTWVGIMLCPFAVLGQQLPDWTANIRTDHPRLFFNGDTRNSYPTLLEYDPGRFYAVWDSSTDPDVKRTAIRFGRFAVEP